MVRAFILSSNEYKNKMSSKVTGITVAFFVALVLIGSVAATRDPSDHHEHPHCSTVEERLGWNPIAQFDSRLVQFLNQLGNITDIMGSANLQFSSIVGTTTKGEDHINQRIKELNDQLTVGMALLERNWKSTAENMELIFKYAGNTLIFGCFIFLMTFIVSPLFISDGMYFPKVIRKLHYIALVLLPACFPFWVLCLRDKFSAVFGPCGTVASICLATMIMIFSFFILINSFLELVVPKQSQSHEDLEMSEKPLESYRLYNHYQKFSWMYEGMVAMGFMTLGIVLFTQQ